MGRKVAHEVVEANECEICDPCLSVEEGRLLVEQDARVPKLASGWMRAHILVQSISPSVIAPKPSKQTPMCPHKGMCWKMQGRDNGTTRPAPSHSTRRCESFHLFCTPVLHFIPSSLFPPSGCACSHPPPPTPTTAKEKVSFPPPTTASSFHCLCIQTSCCIATSTTSFPSEVDVNTSYPKGQVMDPPS